MRKDSLKDHFPPCIRLNGSPTSRVVTDHLIWRLREPGLDCY